MEFIEILKERFEKNMGRHKGITFSEVEERLKDPKILEALTFMEGTGGEVDVIGKEGDKVIVCDCSKESPTWRRSLCYDEKARLSRKKMPPISSAMEEANKHGFLLMDLAMYQRLQSVGEFDLSSSSWILTPEDIREKGGALFCEKRYGHVFVFHNGADSYYSNRGFRGYILI